MNRIDTFRVHGQLNFLGKNLWWILMAKLLNFGARCVLGLKVYKSYYFLTRFFLEACRLS